MTEYLVEADWYVRADSPEEARDIVRDMVEGDGIDLLRVTDQTDPNDKGSYA